MVMNLSEAPLQRESSDPWWAIFDTPFSFGLSIHVVFPFFSVEQRENQRGYVKITLSIGSLPQRFFTEEVPENVGVSGLPKSERIATALLSASSHF